MVYPVEKGNRAQAIKNAELANTLGRVSPINLYTDATQMVMDPYRKSGKTLFMVGPLESLSMQRFSGALPLGQSLLIVTPYLITLLALTVVCFAVSYIIFMRQEVRSM